MLSGLESVKAGEREPLEREGEGGSQEGFFTPFEIQLCVLLLEWLLLDSVQAVKRISGVETESRDCQLTGAN